MRASRAPSRRSTHVASSAVPWSEERLELGVTVPPMVNVPLPVTTLNSMGARLTARTSPTSLPVGDGPPACAGVDVEDRRFLRAVAFSSMKTTARQLPLRTLPGM